MVFGLIRKKIRQDLAMDLGTANTLVYLQGEGIVLDEATVIAFDEYGEVVRFGARAKEFLGKNPPELKILRPMKDGVIEDFQAVTEFIKSCLASARRGRTLVSPRVVVCVPSQITQIEKKAVLDAVRGAGFEKVYLLDEVMAAAAGCGVDLFGSRPAMVVDIGGGTTEVAVISELAYLYCDSKRVAGTELDEAIEAWLKDEYGLWVGPNSAERLKWDFGAASVRDLPARKTEVYGKDLITRQPARCTVELEGLVEAISPVISSISEVIRDALFALDEQTRRAISGPGIWLTGGCSLLRGLPDYLGHRTGITFRVPASPLTTVVEGAGRAMEDFGSFRPLFAN